MDEDRVILLSRLQLKSQQEVAGWNKEGTLKIVHKMSTEFLDWAINEAQQGRWNGEALGAAFCELDEEGRLKLANVPEDLQKRLAVLNKTKTCLSAPMLESTILEWIYEEAVNGRWDQDLVFKWIERREAEVGVFVSARVKHLGEFVL